MAVKPIPDGFHTVTPYLLVEGASKLIDFLRAAFSAQDDRGKVIIFTLRATFDD